MAIIEHMLEDLFFEGASPPSWFQEVFLLFARKDMQSGKSLSLAFEPVAEYIWERVMPSEEELLTLPCGVSNGGQEFLADMLGRGICLRMARFVHCTYVQELLGQLCPTVNIPGYSGPKFTGTVQEALGISLASCEKRGFLQLDANNNAPRSGGRGRGCRHGI